MDAPLGSIFSRASSSASRLSTTWASIRFSSRALATRASVAIRAAITFLSITKQLPSIVFFQYSTNGWVFQILEVACVQKRYSDLPYSAFSPWSEIAVTCPGCGGAGTPIFTTPSIFRGTFGERGCGP